MENIYKINELQFWQQQEDSVLFDEQAAHLSTTTPSMPLCGWLTVTLDCRSTLGVSNTERVKWTSQVVRDCPPRNAELYFNLKYQTPSLPTSLQRWGNSHFYPLISLELALGERRRFLWSTVLGFQVIQGLGKSERGHLIFFPFFLPRSLSFSEAIHWLLSGVPCWKHLATISENPKSKTSDVLLCCFAEMELETIALRAQQQLAIFYR